MCFSDDVYVVVDADVVDVFLMLMLLLTQLLLTASFYSFFTGVDLAVVTQLLLTASFYSFFTGADVVIDAVVSDILWMYVAVCCL